MKSSHQDFNNQPKVKRFEATTWLERLETPVSIYQGTKDPTVKNRQTIGELFGDMVTPKPEHLEKQSHLLQDLYRSDKVAYRQMKETLQAFSIGRFSKRTDKDLEVYVPLLVFDIDGLKSLEQTQTLLDLCEVYKCIYAAFPSVSGCGLRVMIWTDSTLESHKAVYQLIAKDLAYHLAIETDKDLRTRLKRQGLTREEMKPLMKSTPHIDTSTSNVSRLWFYTYVDEALFYWNQDSLISRVGREPLPIKMPLLEFGSSVEHTSDEVGIVVDEIDDLLIDTEVNNVVNEDSENNFTIAEKIDICKDMLSNRAIQIGRNNYVYALAKILYEHGVPEKDVFEECYKYEENDFDKKEIESTVRSALKTATYQKFSDEQLQNYQSIISNATAKGQSNTKSSKKSKTVSKKSSSTPQLKGGKPKKNNKYLQMKQYLSDKYEFRLNMISIELEYKLIEETTFKIMNENNLIIEFLEAGYTGVEVYLIALFKSNYVLRYNPLQEYFYSLPVWDESQPDYIAQLSSYVKAKDQEWFDLQFKKMMVRTIACALDWIPFNKHCFTLLGKQNDGKTSFLRFLCPPNLRDYIKENLDIHNKDGRIALCQNLYINLDELANFSKFDINKTKAFFTIDKVKERIPYDKRPTNFTRKASFLASTNSDEFLTDETGNVRWLVFEVEDIHHDNGGAKGYNKNIDIDLVWSQAFALLKNGFKFQLTSTEISKSEKNNKYYQVTTVEQELIQSFFEPAKEEEENNIDVFFMTSTDILTKLEKINNTRLNIKSIGKALKLLGYARTQKRVTEVNGIVLSKPQPRKGFYVRMLMR